MKPSPSSCLPDPLAVSARLKEYGRWLRGEGEYAWALGKYNPAPMSDKELADLLDEAARLLGLPKEKDG